MCKEDDQKAEEKTWWGVSEVNLKWNQSHGKKGTERVREFGDIYLSYGRCSFWPESKRLPMISTPTFYSRLWGFLLLLQGHFLNLSPKRGLAGVSGPCLCGQRPDRHLPFSSLPAQDPAVGWGL